MSLNNNIPDHQTTYGKNQKSFIVFLIVRTDIIICLPKNINIIILYHYILSTACILVSHTMCVQNHRKVMKNNVEPKQIWESPIHISLFTLVCLSIFIDIFSGTNMYTVYLTISGQSIDLVFYELYLHVRRIIKLYSKRESYTFRYHTCIYFECILHEKLHLPVKSNITISEITEKKIAYAPGVGVVFRLAFIFQLCFNCDIILVRKYVLNKHILNFSPLRRTYFHILDSLFFVCITVYIAVAVLNQYSFRKPHIILRNHSDYEPDTKNNPSVCAAFEPFYVLSCVYCLGECSIIGSLKTVSTLIISSCIIIYCYIYFSVIYTFEVSIRVCVQEHHMGYIVQIECGCVLDILMFLSQIPSR